MVVRGTGTIIDWFGGWSALARVLPQMEKGPLFNAINFTMLYRDPMNTTVTGSTVQVFLCPSESRQEPAIHPVFGQAGVTSYGVSRGDWYVWGGFGHPIPNRSAFDTNRTRRFSEFTDGLSNTLLASEVKTYQAMFRDCGGLSQINNPMDIPPPNADPYTVAPEYQGGSCQYREHGHTGSRSHPGIEFCPLFFRKFDAGSDLQLK